MTDAGSAQLILAALIGIAVIVVLITQFKLHPFLSLTIGSISVGALAGMQLEDSLTSFGTGVGATVAGVGTLIALGAMFGRLLADSGGAVQIVDTIIRRATARTLPWAMALVGALIGLPMFFEIGLVLLIPVILLVSRRSGLPLLRVGIPALAGPVLAKYVARWVPVSAPALFVTSGAPAFAAAGTAGRTSGSARAGVEAETATPETMDVTRRPSFGTTLFTVLLPVVLMMGKALVDIFLPDTSNVRSALDFIGTPLVALLLSVLVAMFTFGRGSGMDRRQIASSLVKSLPPIAGILLIVGAGGGFKQTLIDTGIGGVLAKAIAGSSVSPLLLGWVVVVLIRLATGRPRSPPSRRPGSSPRSPRPCRPVTRRCSCSPSALGRCSSATSTMRGSGWSRSTSA